MNSIGHLALSCLKSAIRIAGCFNLFIEGVTNQSIVVLAAAFFVAEIIGVAEELVDKR